MCISSSFGENAASCSESEIMSSEMDMALDHRPANTFQQSPFNARPMSTNANHHSTQSGGVNPSSANSMSSNATGAQRATLEPLQLVWAKCRGYPWYPALIIDPAIPRGFIYNGVPLPAPPVDVLALRKDAPDDVHLVLFFDAKRTWQWLPPNKLELLGLDKHLDQGKLVESRKPADRKAVKKAYQDALHYQSQVSDLDGQGPGAIM